MMGKPIKFLRGLQASHAQTVNGNLNDYNVYMITRSNKW